MVSSLKISEHISSAEATKSQTGARLGIPNIPNKEQVLAMILVAESCFEPIRKHFGVPLPISSFFRCETLNKAIGGAKNSQHCKGEAIDIDAGDLNKEIYDWAKANLKFDQLIWEYGNSDNPSWVHISFSKHGNRNQCLVIK